MSRRPNYEALEVVIESWAFVPGARQELSIWRAMAELADPHVWARPLESGSGDAVAGLPPPAGSLPPDLFEEVETGRVVPGVEVAGQIRDWLGHERCERRRAHEDEAWDLRPPLVAVNTTLLAEWCDLHGVTMYDVRNVGKCLPTRCPWCPSEVPSVWTARPEPWSGPGRPVAAAAVAMALKALVSKLDGAVHGRTPAPVRLTKDGAHDLVAAILGKPVNRQLWRDVWRRHTPSEWQQPGRPGRPAEAE